MRIYPVMNPARARDAIFVAQCVRQQILEILERRQPWSEGERQLYERVRRELDACDLLDQGVITREEWRRDTGRA